MKLKGEDQKNHLTEILRGSAQCSWLGLYLVRKQELYNTNWTAGIWKLQKKHFHHEEAVSEQHKGL